MCLTPNKGIRPWCFPERPSAPLQCIDNVAYGLKMQALPKEEIHERVMNILKLVEMEAWNHV